MLLAIFINFIRDSQEIRKSFICYAVPIKRKVGDSRIFQISLSPQKGGFCMKRKKKPPPGLNCTYIKAKNAAIPNKGIAAFFHSTRFYVITGISILCSGVLSYQPVFLFMKKRDKPCFSSDKKYFQKSTSKHCQNRIFQRDNYRGAKLPISRARSPPSFLGQQYAKKPERDTGYDKLFYLFNDVGIGQSKKYFWLFFSRHCQTRNFKRDNL